MQSNENQQLVFFYESIKEYLTSKKLTLDEELSVINVENISSEQYRLLGSLAYIFGQEFYQTNNLSQPALKNIIARFTDIGLSSKTASLTIELIQKLDINSVNKPHQILKSFIDEKIDAGMDKLLPIRNDIKTIIRNSSFPIAFALDIEKILNADFLTYHDVLKSNSMIYQQLEIPGKYLKTIIRLYQNSDYTKILETATKYFNFQKFAVIYLDSIVSLKEYYMKYDDVFVLNKFIDKPELVDSYLQECLEVVEKTPEVLNEEDPNVWKHKEVSKDEVDLFVKALLEEGTKLIIHNEEDFIQSIEVLINNTDYVQHMYQYIKTNKNAENRIALSELYPAFYEKIEELLKNKNDEYVSQYKELVLRYTEPIHIDSAHKIISYVNNTIENIVANNSQTKTIFISQLSENSITTYKHLHEIIELIETSSIKGENISAYSQFREYINVNEERFIKLFNDVQEIANLEIKIKMYQEFKSFYFPKIEENIA